MHYQRSAQTPQSQGCRYVQCLIGSGPQSLDLTCTELAAVQVVLKLAQPGSTTSAMPQSKVACVIHLRVPWHSIRDRSKNKGWKAPKDKVRYRRHSKPSLVQLVMLERRLRTTDSGVHNESRRNIWTSCIHTIHGGILVCMQANEFFARRDPSVDTPYIPDTYYTDCRPE